MSSTLNHSLPLGSPIPDSPHACSVSLPQWRDVVGYEEKDPRVIDALKAGYPRFVVPPIVEKVIKQIRENLARDDRAVMVFPSASAARRCSEFIAQEMTGRAGITISEHPSGEAYYLEYPIEKDQRARKYWQHTGEIVSSRLASRLLKPESSTGSEHSLEQLQIRIADLYKTEKNKVFLHPSGMASLYHIHRTLLNIDKTRATAQFGFAYVDTVKIQETFGNRFHAFSKSSDIQYEELLELIKSGQLSAIFTEFPTNPLLTTIPLHELYPICRENKVALIVDDTLSTCVNARLLDSCDFIVNSLTKYFSGTGEVMGGALIANPDSVRVEEMLEKLTAFHDTKLYHEDAAVLLKNSEDFEERILQVNANAEAVADFLSEHPLVESIYYPKFICTDSYVEYRQEGGGFGGLMSIVLKDPENNSEPFFDALDVAKGPSLGTNFTLACPYTLLAHYDELDWAEEQGVSRYLMRISIGLESSQELISKFEAAFAKIS